MLYLININVKLFLRLARVYQVYQTGLTSPRRPIVNLLFLVKSELKLLRGTSDVKLNQSRKGRAPPGVSAL